MNHNYSVEWGPVILLPMTAETSERYRQLRNKIEIRKWFVTSSEISEQQQYEWFQNYLKDDNDIMFSIHSNTDDQTFLGANAIYRIQNDKKIAEYGRLAILPQFSGQGIGFAATMAACAITKAVLRLEKLHLEVYKDNIAAVNIYRKAGFQLNCQSSTVKGSILHMQKKI